MMETLKIQIAVVRSSCGYVTVCGPNDMGADREPMDAAIGWHLEAGYLPNACYWAVVELPPIPAVPEIESAVSPHVLDPESREVIFG